MPSGPFSLERRAFLVALGLVPAAATLIGCHDETPKPLHGPDLGGVDPTVRPQDDLYRHVNGTWLHNFQLPPDKASFGSFDEASDRTEEQLRSIIDGISDPKAGSEAQQIRDLYDARMNLDDIEKLGITPLQGMFADIDKAPDKPALAKVMGALPTSGLFSLGVSVDRKNSTAYIASIEQAGLGLGQQYYQKPEFAQIVDGYRSFLERVAQAAGLPDPAGMARREIDLETRIASVSWDDVRNRDTQATYNRRHWADVVAAAPQFDWDSWLAGTTDRPKELFNDLVVGQPSFVTEAGKIWADTDIAQWRDFLKLALLRDFARYLPKAFADANFDFNGRLMAGLQQRPPQWKTAVATVGEKLGEQLGKVYVDKYFPPASKARAKDMVADIMAAYRDNFTHSNWMSPDTRKAAIDKLDKITVKIGYPDKWVDYSGLHITRGKLIDSLRAINDFENRRSFAKLGNPVDKTEWSMSPQTVNAYYNPTGNEIVFPAAYLQPPFFDPDAQSAVNFGSVGGTIGHEIGHGFDDQGSQYDGDGNLRDWWTPQDRAAFATKTQALIAQYNALVPKDLDPGQHVNGALTVGENLADLRGLQIALAAFELSEKRRGNEKPDFTPVFQSWARCWRNKETREATQQQIASDVHSPSEFRCNQVVRNIEKFYTTFGVNQADALFLPPEQRVVL